MSAFNAAAASSGGSALPAVSAAVGLICLIGAVLNVYVGKNHWPKLTVALVLTGATGLLNATFGSAIHDAVNKADGTIGQGIGKFTGTIVAGLVGAVLIGYVALRLKHKQYDKKTFTATALVPPTVTLIPGTLGTIATTAVGIVPAAVAWFVGWSFGIGG
jgi:hypothetical protein